MWTLLIVVISYIVATFGGLIDLDTPVPFRSTHRHHDGKLLTLMMSDEFNKDGRSFGPGKDMLFEAMDKPDNSNNALQYYNSSSEYVYTKNGELVIKTSATKTEWIEWDDTKLEHVKKVKNYTSGMLQSWNKFCFTGGIIELSVKLPGPSNSAGVWPAAWLMGNLARATHEDSTMDVWPWSYNKCGEIKDLDRKQKINACDNNPGNGFLPNQGRGSPEIDIFEVMPGHFMPYQGYVQGFMSNSLQISPGIAKTDWKRPVNGHHLNESCHWYDGLRIGDNDNSEYNWGFWGQECGPDKIKDPRYKYMQDALSLNTLLNDTHFTYNHRYRIEWQPGNGGYLEWYLDDSFIFGIDDETLNNRTGSTIPYEPLYLILNTALSNNWGFPEPCDKEHCDACYHCYDCHNPDCQCSLPEGLWNCKVLPTHMTIDYIRLYQDKSDPSHTIGCSPDKYPTATYIKNNPHLFQNWSPNKKALSVTIIEFILRSLVFMSIIFAVLVVYRRIIKVYFIDHCSFSFTTCWNGIKSRIGLSTNNRGEYEPLDEMRDMNGRSTAFYA